MIDYSNVVVLQPVGGRRRRPRLLLAFVVLVASFGWHVAGSVDAPPAPERPSAGPSDITPAQLAEMRANGRLLSLRGLMP